ncbi:hypothetical protein JZ751_017455 [Albula glossodonta]|uniref:Heterochromatin protein 1-binding protein 3 n=1 Tax=Albula glossodonta TaxID=121402 RepID=A0A8T2PKL5_9TELE|nr:hypothetical protein JZ751_017455 [Albula glossodonta]
MPIRRKAETPPKDTPPSDAPEGAPDASSEESAPMEEAPEPDPAPPALPVEEVQGGEVNGESENTEASGETEVKSTEEKTPEEGDGEEKEDGKEKVKKVKRTIPAWATVAASKRAKSQKGSATLYSHPKLDDILLEAIKASKDRNGASAYAIMKYITNKYAALELDRRKFLLRKSLNRLMEKGMVKQLKGKGFSGSFNIDKLPKKSNNDVRKPLIVPGVKAETLGDSLPLIITRLCEPKEASYTLIKKYLEQHFPKLNVEQRPELLKIALQKAVEKGHLEQITGKGASGTFQLKGSRDKHLLQGGALEDAILAAITAMNEPKSCSTALLRKFLVETYKDSKAYMLVNNLKRTLKRCKTMGWIEQVTGSGLNGTYQLCYPYYPSPAILFPEKQTQESEDEEEEEDDSEYEAPPRKRSRQQRRQPSKARHPNSARMRWPANQRATGKRPAAASRRSAPAARKSAAKKVITPAKKPKAALSRKLPPPPKSTKKAAPAGKPKTAVVKKIKSRAPTRSVTRKSLSTKESPKSSVKAKPSARKSLRSKK